MVNHINTTINWDFPRDFPAFFLGPGEDIQFEGLEDGHEASIEEGAEAEVRSEMTGVAGFKDWWLSYDHIDIYIHFFGGFWSHGGYAHANHGALRLKGWISWFRGTLFSDKPIYIYTYIYIYAHYM